MDVIYIKGLKIETIIGVYAEEKLTKQPIIIDIRLYCDISKAALTDDIKFALDYYKISNDLHQYVSTTRFELIETLAESCTTRLLKINGVKKVKLKLSKPEALDKAENVGLIITRK